VAVGKKSEIVDNDSDPFSKGLLLSKNIASVYPNVNIIVGHRINNKDYKGIGYS